MQLLANILLQQSMNYNYSFVLGILNRIVLKYSFISDKRLVIQLYIYGKGEVNLTVCKCTKMEKQGIQRMILFIVKIFVHVKCFGFILSHHQGI